MLIATAMFRLKATFPGNTSIALSVLCPFTPTQKHLFPQLFSLRSLDFLWSKEQDDVSREVAERDCMNNVGHGFLGRALPSISCF